MLFYRLLEQAIGAPPAKGDDLLKRSKPKLTKPTPPTVHKSHADHRVLLQSKDGSIQSKSLRRSEEHGLHEKEPDRACGDLLGRRHPLGMWQHASYPDQSSRQDWSSCGSFMISPPIGPTFPTSGTVTLAKQGSPHTSVTIQVGASGRKSLQEPGSSLVDHPSTGTASTYVDLPAQ